MGSTSEMSPEASPGHVSKKFGVRRVNNVPVYLVWGLVLAFCLMIMLVAIERAAKQNAPADSPDERVGNTAMFAKEIIGNDLEIIINNIIKFINCVMRFNPINNILIFIKCLR